MISLSISGVNTQNLYMYDQWKYSGCKHQPPKSLQV